MTVSRLIVCLLLFVGVYQGVVATAQGSLLDDGTIYIGVLAKDGKEECFQQWNPTAAYLREKLPEFKFQIVCLGFDEVDSVVSEEKVDFTITNPSMYVNLEFKYGASRISTLKNRSSRTSYTQLGGVIFYRADRTDINKVEDLKGKKFMAVADNAFAGWLVSYRYLKERGIDPYHDFQQLLFGGRNDNVVLAVERGDVDAGCVRTDTLERMAWQQKIALKDFNILNAQEITEDFKYLRTTRLYPEWPLAKVQHTSQELAKRVALAMMQMPEKSIAARYSRTKGWTIPLDYNEVHTCLRLLQVPPYNDFGTITFNQLYQLYRRWIYVGLIFLFCIFTGVAVVLKLNRKLKLALGALDLEHRQKVRMVAYLDEFKLTLDQTLDCVFMFSSETLQFIYANQGALDHIGYSRKELFGMTPLDIKPEITEADFRVKILPLQQEPGTSLTYTTTTQRKDGTLVPVEVFVQHITPPQKQGRFVAIVRDITVRLQQEKEREFLQSRLLQEQKLASVGQLAAGIAHEINTPAQYLGSNIGFLDEAFTDISRLVNQFDQLLQAAKAEKLSQQLIKATENSLEEADWCYLKEEIPQAIKQSIDGVKQVSSIVLAMKNFAHPGGVEKELSDINEILQTTLTVSRNEWKYLVEPILHLEAHLPQVFCMRNELGQVFLNLFVNATESIAEKLEPKPESRKGQLIISSRHEGNSVVVTIRDTGCGISKANLQKIFDPFFTTKEVGKGTGQGLTTAYDIITNKHGGTLEVSSEEGVGTTFTITLSVDPSLQENKEDSDSVSA